jgi:hypothetical protein
MDSAIRVSFLFVPASNIGLNTIVSEYPSPASPSSVRPLLLVYRKREAGSAPPTLRYETPVKTEIVVENGRILTET